MDFFEGIWDQIVGFFTNIINWFEDLFSGLFNND